VILELREDDDGVPLDAVKTMARRCPRWSLVTMQSHGWRLAAGRVAPGGSKHGYSKEYQGKATLPGVTGNQGDHSGDVCELEVVGRSGNRSSEFDRRTVRFGWGQIRRPRQRDGKTNCQGCAPLF
jgi:hypothetical protein